MTAFMLASLFGSFSAANAATATPMQVATMSELVAPHDYTTVKISHCVDYNDDGDMVLLTHVRVYCNGVLVSDTIDVAVVKTGM